MKRIIDYLKATYTRFKKWVVSKWRAVDVDAEVEKINNSLSALGFRVMMDGERSEPDIDERSESIPTLVCEDCDSTIEEALAYDNGWGKQYLPEPVWYCGGCIADSLEISHSEPPFIRTHVPRYS